MLAEPYLRRRFEAGRKEGIEEGREEGREQGREEGIEEGREEERKEASRRIERISAKIKAWNQRRLEHEANGEPFDEPLPDFDADDEASK